MEKTHWKKAVSDPNYVGEADFEDGEEKVVTIQRVSAAETVVTAEGKTKKAVVHFEEGIKPMILNVARSKSIEKVAGSPYFEDWPGVKIQLYIEKGIKAFGELVNAVRVRPFKPRIKAQEPVPRCADCGGEIAPVAGRTAAYLAKYTAQKYGVPLCAECASKRMNVAENQAPVKEAQELAPEKPEQSDFLPDEEEI